MAVLLIGGCGYVGSVLAERLLQTRVVKCIDTERRGNPGNVPHLNVDYAHLSTGLIQCYDDIVLLAAHSSVSACVNDPSGAFSNNVLAFQHLLERLDKHQRLVYASSSSVYSGFGAAAASEDNAAGNMYDASKMMNDMLASLSGKRTYGLRFGTICGPSPNLRKELMLNSMCESASNNGYVQISNPKIRRPILGISDLVRAVTAILDGSGEPGIYNLASFNSTVAHLGGTVAAELDVPLILGEPSPSYDFTISSNKFMEVYDFQFEETAESIVAGLVTAHGSNSRSAGRVHTPAALSSV